MSGMTGNVGVGYMDWECVHIIDYLIKVVLSIELYPFFKFPLVLAIESTSKSNF